MSLAVLHATDGDVMIVASTGALCFCARSSENGCMNKGQQFFKDHPEAVAPAIAIGVWSLIWKAFALYRAGANRSPGWFAALLLLNTVGILEMLYLFVFGKKKRAKEAHPANLTGIDER